MCAWVHARARAWVCVCGVKEAICVCVRACVSACARARARLCVHALLSPAPTDAQNLLGQVVRDAGTQFCPVPFRSVEDGIYTHSGPLTEPRRDQKEGGGASRALVAGWINYCRVSSCSFNSCSSDTVTKFVLHSC